MTYSKLMTEEELAQLTGQAFDRGVEVCLQLVVDTLKHFQTDEKAIGIVKDTMWKSILDERQRRAEAVIESVNV